MSPTHSFLCKSLVFKLVNKIIFFAMFIYLILISKKTTNSVKAKQFSFKRKTYPSLTYYQTYSIFHCAFIHYDEIERFEY